jgi:hypothetical protein
MKSDTVLRSNVCYYDDLNNIYINRLDAIRSGNPCKFYYYDDVFSKLDWSAEPRESLAELYKQRAQQIRDQYEHVVLCYSGGIDSTTMLETFYYNGIHIDEILVVGAISQDARFGSDQNHNADLYYNVFPTLNAMDWPNTKITVIDYTKHFDDVNKFTLLQKYGADYVEHIGIRTSVHNLLWYDLDRFMGHKKHTAYVMGKEKPIIRYDASINRYYACFYDISYTDYGNRYEYSTGNRINFYSEPDAFPVMLKQYYMIKSAAEYMRPQHETPGVNIFDDYVERIKPIIYSLKIPLQHQSFKSRSTYLSARDMFMVDKKDSDIYRIYSNAVYNLNKTVDISKKIVFESKPYYLS